MRPSAVSLIGATITFSYITWLFQLIAALPTALVGIGVSEGTLTILLLVMVATLAGLAAALPHIVFGGFFYGLLLIKASILLVLGLPEQSEIPGAALMASTATPASPRNKGFWRGADEFGGARSSEWA